MCRDDEIATRLLLQLVQGKKRYMKEKKLDVLGFSNIAAIEVN